LGHDRHPALPTLRAAVEHLLGARTPRRRRSRRSRSSERHDCLHGTIGHRRHPAPSPDGPATKLDGHVRQPWRRTKRGPRHRRSPHFGARCGTAAGVLAPLEGGRFRWSTATGTPTLEVGRGHTGGRQRLIASAFRQCQPPKPWPGSPVVCRLPAWDHDRHGTLRCTMASGTRPTLRPPRHSGCGGAGRAEVAASFPATSRAGPDPPTGTSNHQRAMRTQGSYPPLLTQPPFPAFSLARPGDGVHQRNDRTSSPTSAAVRRSTCSETPFRHDHLPAPRHPGTHWSATDR